MTYNNEGKVFVPIYQLDYRNKHLDFYWQDKEQLFFTFIDNKPIFFSQEEDFKQSAKHLIDIKLDTIAIFDNAKLEYFENAGHRDIRLICDNRIIKIYLVNNEKAINFNRIISQAKESILHYNQINKICN